MRKFNMSKAIKSGELPTLGHAKVTSHNKKYLEEDLKYHFYRGKDNKFQETIKIFTKIFKSTGVDWGIGGALAFELYAILSRIDDIDIVFEFSSKSKVVKAIKAAGLKVQKLDGEHVFVPGTDRTVPLKLLFGHADLEESAAATAQTISFFGVRTKLIKPEFLLWMLLLPDKDEYVQDIRKLELLKIVDVVKLNKYLEWSEDTLAQEKLKKLVSSQRDQKSSATGLTWAQVQQRRRASMRTGPRVHTLEKREKVVKETEKQLNKHYDAWSSQWLDYADKINSSLGAINKYRKEFRKWSPLKIYLPISDAMSTGNKFSLRFKGQNVAKIIAKNEGSSLMIEKKVADANRRYFKWGNGQSAEMLWKSNDAKEFRKHFKNCTDNGHSQEHMFESLILDEMEKSSKGKFLGSLYNIQPVTIAKDIRFQMPVPLSGNTGEPVFKRGNIDILCRFGVGRGVKLAIVELKRNDRRSYKKAIVQSLIYSICMRYLLKDDRCGEKWWKILGFKGKVPKKLTISSVVMIPQELSGLYEKEKYSLGFIGDQNKITIENDTIELNHIFFEQVGNNIRVTETSL